MGLRPLACWNCVFESQRGTDVSLLCMLCPVHVEVFATGPIPRPEESYLVCVGHLSMIRCNNNYLHLQWGSKSGQKEIAENELGGTPNTQWRRNMCLSTIAYFSKKSTLRKESIAMIHIYIVQIDLILLKRTSATTLQQDTPIFRTPCVRGLDTILRTCNINRLSLKRRRIMFCLMHRIRSLNDFKMIYGLRNS